MSKNRCYDPDFKAEAIRLVLEDGRAVREVERSLGITFGLLKNWVKARRGDATAPRGGLLTDLPPTAREKALEKENERLRRERDILKKAVAIFSTDPNRYSGS
jgi:transposase